jgi:hypothetical protein
MLIENSLGEFSDAQPLDQSAASTNVIDLAQARHQVGVGGQLWLWLRTNVEADFTNTDETYLFAFEVDTVENFASPRCVFALTDSDGSAIATADPESTALKTAGKTIFAGTLPYGVTERYARWNCTHATGTAVLKVDAQLLAGPPPANASDSQVYVSNITVPS